MYTYTVYDPIFDDTPDKNTVHAPHIHMDLANPAYYTND
jgi:hypothetical protein